jgi:hypothetical protein
VILILKRAVVFTALFLFGCSSDQLRINKVFNLAQHANLTPSVINTSQFSIQIFTQNHNSKHAVIYLEGDGLVLNRYGEIALNPTPTDPMAVRLASVDRRPFTKIVVNRPFHYGDRHAECSLIRCPGLKVSASRSRNKFGMTLSHHDNVSPYWTTARYAPEVIQSIYEAINQCQQQFRFETIELVAYSGGASVALLLTPYFKNITRIISFAGNLDHKNWTSYHGTQPLFESLDPMENKEFIRKIPQIHFVGASDDNTTPELAKAYKQKIDSDKISIIVIDGFAHDGNWPSIWQEQLLRENPLPSK